MVPCFVYCLLAVPCGSPQDGMQTVPVDTSVLYVFGDNYTYECIDGYENSGELMSTCQSDRNWSLSPPACTGKIFKTVLSISTHIVRAIVKMLIFN